MIELCRECDCTACGACYNICFKSAISMVSNEEGFKYPRINEHLCVECGLCQKACPILNPIEKHQKAEAPLAVVSKSEEIRMKSSSGGMFSLLASWILNRNGVVYGAVFDENYDVYHCYAETEDELGRQRGSKYAQSDTKETYKQVKVHLKEGRFVLYTGTPCQIAGLYQYLGNCSIENLWTADLVCHGVPSVKSFQTYLKKLAEKKNITVKDIKNFRFRELEGWGYAPSFQFAKNTYYSVSLEENLYMRLFLSNRLHRPSCYNCRFVTPERVGDISIADFWGVGKYKPYKYDTTKGCSLVLLNTEKGNRLFNAIATELDYDKRSWEEALKVNNQLHSQPVCPKDREEAIFSLYNNDYNTTYNRFFNTPYLRFRRLIGKILRILHLR